LKNYHENEILQKLANGDQFSFGIVFNTYYSRLYYFALHYLNDEESAKDVVQDVFSATWEDRGKFSEVKNLSSWLFSLTKNLSLKKIDHLKVKQKHTNLLKYRQLNIIQHSLNDLDTSPVIFDEISSIIDQTLDKLTPQSRRVFELSRFENKKNREIADELNISQKAVEAHITKALKDFKKALKNYLPFILLFFI
jgi:RNA polymerase sigma-70 factor (ECF subfamily)